MRDTAEHSYKMLRAEHGERVASYAHGEPAECLGDFRTKSPSVGGCVGRRGTGDAQASGADGALEHKQREN